MSETDRSYISGRRSSDDSRSGGRNEILSHPESYRRALIHKFIKNPDDCTSEFVRLAQLGWRSVDGSP